MAKKGWRSANLSPDRRVFFGQGRGGFSSREIASRVARSFGSRSGSSTADLLFPLIFPPTLISVTPSTGTSAGGTSVDLAGMNFQPGATVTFGGTPATIVSVTPTHISVTTPAHASGLVNVTVANPDLQSSTLVGAYSYTFPSVIVGTGGTVALSSDDGLTWIQRVIPANSYSDVCWNGSIYCAVGQTGGGGAATSSDGINWVAQTLAGSSGSWNRIAWNGTVFCTIARNAQDTATSPDGVNWTVHTGALSTGNFRGLASNGTIFVAVGSFGQNATSPDGITWTDHGALPGSGSEYNSVVWSADLGIFCTMSNFEAFFPNPGRSAISSDGINWSSTVLLPQAFLFGVPGMSWNGTVFVGVGTANGQPAGAMTSPNGLTWTNRPSLSNAFEWTFAFWTGAVFVTGTAGGGIQLATSADNGVTWVTQGCPFVPSAGASPIIGES